MDKQRTTGTRCSGKKLDGTGCSSYVLPGSNFCFFHDPTKATERREAQASGGRHNRIQTLGATAPDVKVEDCGDVGALITETINLVRKGLIDPRIANSVGYLANVLIKAFDQSELETRIEKLEELLERRNDTSELTMTGA